MRQARSIAPKTSVHYSRWSRFMQDEVIWGYFFIAPICLGLIIFSILPLISSLALSFTSWEGSGRIHFNGLANFAEMMKDKVYLKAMRTSAIYTVVVVPVSIGLSIIVAVLLNRKMRGNILYRLIFFLPSITMPVAIAVVWKWMYNYNNGLINFLLGLFGINGPHWMADPHMILCSIMLISVWSGIGHHMIILLAGLQGIPETYYEAASIDGATGLRRFWYITVPLLTPAIFFVLITSMIGAFQVFDLVYMVTPQTGGGGGILMDATRTAVYSIYQNGFQWFRIGYASAQAWLLFIIIFCVTMVQLKIQKKWVYYD